MDLLRQKYNKFLSAKKSHNAFFLGERGKWEKNKYPAFWLALKGKEYV